MTSQRPDISAWEGHVVPGVVDPNIRRKWVTNQPYGPPIKEEKVFQQQGPSNPAGTPHPLGDDAHPGHGGAMGLLQKMLKKAPTQPGYQITGKMPAYRDWR